MSKTIHIKGPAGVREAQAITKLHDQAMAAQEELRAEFQRRADAMSEEFRVQMLEHWRKLFVHLDLPEDQIGKWGLDARYLEAHGAAFLHKQGTCACGMDHGDDEEAGNGIQGLLAQITGQGTGRTH